MAFDNPAAKGHWPPHPDRYPCGHRSRCTARHRHLRRQRTRSM